MPASLDVKGLNCPLPVLRIRKRLRDVAVGETLAVEATDPGVIRDAEAFCRAGGHALVAAREEAGIIHLEIRRGA
jgi:tRNA 2-thiouridine synthesizing protein A